MARSVVISTPIPSADQVAESIGMSKARLRRIRQIVDEVYPVKSEKYASAGLVSRHRDSNGNISSKRADQVAASKSRSK